MSLLDLDTVLLSLPKHIVVRRDSCRWYDVNRYTESAEVRCNDLAFSVHLYTEFSHRYVCIYFTHVSWQDICRAWDPVTRSISEIFIGHYFLVFQDPPPVLSYDQILTAMMHHVFQP